MYGYKWFLPSRGRPKLCQECLDACADAQMTGKGIVYVDGRVDCYDNLKLPSNWTKVIGFEDLAPAKEWFWHNYAQDETFVGLIRDDLLPKTTYFDEEMEEGAWDWYLVDTNDLWFAREGIPDHRLSGAFGWGAKLVRAVGWWSLPGIQRAGNDDAWNEIVQRRLQLRKHLHHVIVEHRQHKNNKREKDETDNYIRDGVSYTENDLKVFNKWRKSGKEVSSITNKIVGAMAKDGIRYEDIAVVKT